MMEKINKIKSIRESLTNILGRSPTVKEISIKAGLKIKEVNEILKEIDEPISLSTPTGVNDSSMTLEDTIQDDSLTLDLSVENKIIMKEFKEESKRILTDIEYKIITKHLGIDTRVHTLKELSIRFNYSNKDKVRTIRDRALRKIKRNMYIKNLWEEVEEKTLYYRSIDYSQTMVSGGTVSSSVENIALSREKQFNQLDKGDFKG